MDSTGETYNRQDGHEKEQKPAKDESTKEMMSRYIATADSLQDRLLQGGTTKQHDAHNTRRVQEIIGQSLARLTFQQKPQSPFSEEQKKSVLSPVLTSSLSNSEEHDKPVPIKASFTKTSWHELVRSRRNEDTRMMIVEQDERSIPEELTAANSQMFLSLDTVGGMSDQPGGLSVGGSAFLTGSDDFSDEDHDLEQSADQFLSNNFGVSLSKLRRPHRIIYALQHVKDQCASILEDEGHHFMESPRKEESQSEPVDGEDTYHSTGGDRAYSIHGDPPTLAGTKRPGHDAVKSEDLSGPSVLTKTARHKKRRTEGDFSCPYRKRNPRRFNVRDHEECANRSYKDFSMLKKHITAYHFKAHVCSRCNQVCVNQDVLLAHLERCDHPPSNRPLHPYINPEDGVDNKTENILKSRKATEQIKDWPALWRLLFPVDTSVPGQDFEPVVEDHDLIFTYKRSQSQISQRLDALDLGHSSEQIKALVFEEIEGLLRCGGSRDQVRMPSSTSSTNTLSGSSGSRNRDIAIVDRESVLANNPQTPTHVTGAINVEGPRPPVESRAQNYSAVGTSTNISSTNVAYHPLPQYSQPVIPEPTQQFGATTEGTSNPSHGDNGLGVLQSSALPQSTLLYTPTAQFSQNMGSDIPQDGPSTLDDQAEVWKDFSNLFDSESNSDADC
ncbi:hypothetical protein F4860DRAFT_84505 [Xylaria cubensis]|nr:hypothetical protein F4860DRAFT_84505 [Xylaria cubensis]